MDSADRGLIKAPCRQPRRPRRKGGFYDSRMAHCTFRIRQGAHSSDVPVDLPDDDAAWNEATMTCADMIRDTVTRFRDSPEWRLEVVDGSGTIRHLFRLTAETFK
jgi:hypothetical protein